MSLKDIKFQDQAVRCLQNVIRNERLASTYLFTGPEGVGKEKAAITFAKTLNCEVKGHDSCDECSTCKRMDSLSHPDLIVLKPQGKTYLIRLDDVRLLQKRMALTPYEARIKIGLVLNADNMNEESQNALLKLLEEPPPNSVLILISQEPQHLLPTIISRCQEVKFSPLKREDIERLLTEDYGIKPDYSKVLSRISRGSLSQALESERDDREDKIQSFLKEDIPIYELLKGVPRDEMDRTLRIFVTLYRDILMVKYGIDEETLINIDHRNEIIKFSSSWSLEYIEGMLKASLRAKALLSQMVNPKLALLEMELERGRYYG